MIKMDYRFIKKLALFYMVLPIIIFFIGWLKWYIAIITVGLLLFGLFNIIRTDCADHTKVISLSKKSIYMTIILSMLWCLFAGQGGIFYQSSDHDIRNAIFRDLINYDWPVIYGKSNISLVYYVGHWLVPAVIGKLSLSIGGEAVAWKIGNIALYIWSTIGIILVILLLYFTVKVKSTKDKFISIVVFVFFSGLDVVGIILQCFTNRRLILIDHIESWSGFWEYSSMTTGLFWVFNQIIVAWLVILLFLNEYKIKQYAFIGLCSLPFAPIPFIGMLPFFIGNAIKRFYQMRSQKQIKNFMKEVFSIPNITATLSILPIFAIYYSSNKVVNDRGFGLSNGLNERGIIKTIIILILFMILEFGVYAVLVWKQNRRNINYYISVGCLLIIPAFRLGNASDFVMRASIPALTILLVLIIDALLNYNKSSEMKSQNKRSFNTKILILLLIVGAATPMLEFCRSGYNTLQEGLFNSSANITKTLSDKEVDEIANFTTDNSDKKYFFKFLVR